jgi:hypothetical protein
MKGKLPGFSIRAAFRRTDAPTSLVRRMIPCIRSIVVEQQHSEPWPLRECLVIIVVGPRCTLAKSNDDIDVLFALTA